MSRPIARLPVLLALTTCLLVAVVGCSSNSTSTGANGAPNVTIGKAIDTIGFSTADVASAEGYFTDAKVNVKTQLFEGSTPTNAALQGGGIQFAMVSSTSFLLAASQGVPLLAVASLDTGDSEQLVVSNKWIADHNLSPTQPLVQRMQGLKGAKLAAISVGAQTYMKELLSAGGAPTDSVGSVTLGTSGAAAAALQHGTLQLFISSPPVSYFVAKQTNATVFATTADIPKISGQAYDLLVTTPSFAKKNPATVAAVATAISRAEDLMRSQPNEALPTISKHFTQYDSQTLLQSIQNVSWSTGGKFTPQMWQLALANMKAGGSLKGDVDLTEGKVWTNQYVTQG